MLDRRKHLKLLSLLVAASTSRWSLAQSLSGTDSDLAKQHDSSLSLGNRNNDAQHYNFPGGVVDLRWPKTSDELPIVKYGLSEPILFDLGDSWRCLVGLELDTLPGEYVVYVKESDSELPAFALRFSVEQRLYPVFTARIPKAEYSQRIDKFSILDFVNSIPPELPLQPPVDIDWQDTFGRVFVDENQAQSSSDFVSQNGQILSIATVSTGGALVVVAPQNGIVCNLYPSPNRRAGDDESMLLIIDHGRGLFSCLDGIRDLTVELGNGVVRGAVLGKVQREQRGTEGNRSAFDTKAKQTESRLTATTTNAEAEQIAFRWFCIINNAYVNPLILTELS